MDAHEGQDHHGHQNHHAAMVADFRKRVWISLVLTLPIKSLAVQLTAKARSLSKSKALIGAL